MHVSLDSALGRQRRLNSVGESVLQIAPNAAAAYSLRSLTGGDPKVVRVRRASGNAEEDFTASEVSSGALTSFVNDGATVSPIADLNVDIADQTTGDTGSYSFGANDILVDRTNGNDGTGDGSESNPYATIAKGLDEITSGNTVWVKGGTYAENTGSGYLLVNSLSFAAETALRAVPGETVVITNVSGAYVFRTNTDIDNFTFRGITFRNANSVTYIFYLTKDSSNFKIQDCRIEAQHSATYAIRDNGTVSGSASTTITNTAFTGPTNGIQSLNTVGITLSNNYYEKSTADPIFANLRAGCGGTIAITGNRSNGGIATSGDSFDVSGTSLEISNNRINISDNSMDAINVRGGTSSNAITINVQNNLIESQDVGVNFYNYISSGTVSGNKIHAGKNQAGNKTGLGIPVDGVTPVTALVQSLTVANNEVRSDGGHAFLMSINSANHTVTGNKFDASQGGDHALVIKGDGHTLTNNKSLGGTRTSYYLKGATNITTTNHVALQSVSSGNCIEVNPDDSTTPDTATANCSTTKSAFIATNGDLYTITSSDLTGSNVVFNNNNLIVKDSGAWGSLNGTTVTSLASVRLAWDAYIATNDEDSFEELNGFVQTWYDQSGNSNDAVQATAGNQPLIVSDGSLVPDDGIDFDGSNFLAATPVSGLEGSFSMFAASIRDGLGHPVSISKSAASNRYFAIQEATSSSQAIPRNSTSGVSVSDSVSGNTRLTFALTTSSTSTSVGALGSAVTTTTDDYGDDFTSGSGMNQIAIGLLRTVSPTGYFNGRIREIIVYTSDQTDNRGAIEANIANHYNITLV
jgi:hypothetical protein